MSGVLFGATTFLIGVVVAVVLMALMRIFDI